MTHEVLGSVEGMDFGIELNSEPWMLPIDALVVSVGPGGGYGELGERVRERFPASAWPDYPPVTPDSPFLVEVNSKDGGHASRVAVSLRGVILVTVREGRPGHRGRGEPPATLGAAQRAVLGAVQLAAASGVRSLGIPILGAGNLGFDLVDAATATMRSLGAALPTLSRSQLDQIFFVCKDEMTKSAIQQAWNEHVRRQEIPDLAAEARLVIPAITGDRVEGVDQLGIDKDARALAALISSRTLEPPLAVGLYGEWGSGKTFFMKKVEAATKELSEAGHEDGRFHRNVAHVWFNAWHYARGNIWASLLEHIFRELSPRQSKHDATISAMYAHVEGTKQVLDQANKEVVEAQERARSLAETVSAAERDHAKAADRIAMHARVDVWSKIRMGDLADPDLQEDLGEAARTLGANSSLDTAEDLAFAAGEVLALGSTARSLATVGGLRSPLMMAVTAVLGVGAIGLVVVSFVDDWKDPVTAVLLQLSAIVAAAATWTKRQASVARTLLEPALRVQRNAEKRLVEQRRVMDAELDQLRQEASAAVLALTAAREQRNEAESNLSAATKAKNDLTADQLLKRYLAERAGSEDYEKYLGVVALAHRDLKDLSLYLQHAASGATQGSAHLDRVILYIDDLDRCEPETVVDVLDAVHLLLALPLFAVVVGVDPRWLVSSLRRRHTELLGSEVSTTAADYLEKIFYLTYTLPPMSAAGSAALMRSSVSFVERKQPGVRGGNDVLTYPKTQAGDDTNADDQARISVDTGEPAIAPRSVVEGLTMADADLDVLQRLAPLVATSPRRAKRFLSAYLVIRARVLSDPVWRTRFNRAGENSGTSSLALLTALFLGLPRMMHRAIGCERVDQWSSQTFREWTQLQHTEDPDERSRLDRFCASAGPLLQLKMVDVLSWEEVVKPYSGLQSILFAAAGRDSERVAEEAAR